MATTPPAPPGARPAEPGAAEPGARPGTGASRRRAEIRAAVEAGDIGRARWLAREELADHPADPWLAAVAAGSDPDQDPDTVRPRPDRAPPERPAQPREGA